MRRFIDSLMRFLASESGLTEGRQEGVYRMESRVGEAAKHSFSTFKYLDNQASLFAWIFGNNSSNDGMVLGGRGRERGGYSFTLRKVVYIHENYLHRYSIDSRYDFYRLKDE